jgi:putative methyltransferase (TIGR04325 family)
MSAPFIWAANGPFRSVLKQLLPPALVGAFRKAREKSYPSFAEAARNSPESYDSEELTRFRVAKAKLNIQQLSAEALPSGYSLLLAAVAMSESAEPQICDFGGACGEWGHCAQKDTQGKRPRVTVVETASLVRACAADSSFTWAEWSQEIPQAFDIFLASGSLPYVEDPYRVLADAFARAKEFVIITRTTFAEQEHFRVSVTPLKNNGFGKVIPSGFDAGALVYYPERTLSLTRVRQLAREHGFEVKLQLEPQAGRTGQADAFERDLLFARNAKLP